MNYQTFDQYLTDNRERLLEDYKDFLRQPSVAATGQGIVEMAALVARRLAGLGFDVKIVPTGVDTPPVVWAELGDGPNEMLIYNHYDVQPAEPLDLWETRRLSQPSEMGACLHAARQMTKANWSRAFTRWRRGSKRKASCHAKSSG